jgi:hypothetical protein
MPNKNKRTQRKKSAANSTAKRKPKKPKTIKAAFKSVSRKKKFSAKKRKVTNTGVVVGTASLASIERLQSRDEGAGDVQGLSNRKTADSESVEELLEEGNALEAEAVEGVESAQDAADQGEVKTHEVPEDDVPQEYLDRDR